MGCVGSNDAVLETFPVSEPIDKQIRFLLKIFSHTDDLENVKLEKSKTGASNLILIFSCSAFKAVVHIYSEGMKDFNHDREKENIKIIGFSKILAEFTNGYVLNYFEGEILTLDSMKEERISSLIAKKIAKFHAASPVKNQNDIYKILDSLRIPADLEFLNEKTQNLQNIIEKELESTGFVLTHGDLHPSNIILQDNDVQLIDYESSAYTWGLYDVADHFMMMTGFQVDMRRFPSIAEQTHFLTVYLTAFNGTPPTQTKLEDSLKKVQLLVKLGELIVACWGFLQAKNPTKDLPYRKYAEARLKCMDYDLPLPEGHELARGPLVPEFPV